MSFPPPPAPPGLAQPPSCCQTTTTTTPPPLTVTVDFEFNRENADTCALETPYIPANVVLTWDGFNYVGQSGDLYAQVYDLILDISDFTLTFRTFSDSIGCPALVFNATTMGAALLGSYPDTDDTQNAGGSGICECTTTTAYFRNIVVS